MDPLEPTLSTASDARKSRSTKVMKNGGEPVPDEALLRVYLRSTPPVQWMAWYWKLEAGPARQDLESVLFHQSRELRDLTDAAVRRAVVDCVLRHPLLIAMVVAGAEEAVEALAARIQKQSESGG